MTSNGSSGIARQKHVPERTCVACRNVKPKRELTRLVCGPGGMVEVDPSGRKPGRGAYLCQSPECWQKGLNRGKLEHALRSKINAESRTRLLRLREAMAESRPGRMGENS